MSTEKHLEVIDLSLADESVSKIKAGSGAIDEKAAKSFKSASDKENCINSTTNPNPNPNPNPNKAEPATPSSATVRRTDAPSAQDSIDGMACGSELKLQSYVNGNGNGIYKIIKTLGKGNFAKVKLALHVPTGREVAIKVIDKTQLNTSARQKLYREVRIMKLLNHPNIVRLFQVIESERTLYLIMEYASRGELFDHLVKHGKMRERDARAIFRQLVSAIQYCHSKFVVHRDLKAENLLLDHQMNIKIADFGFGNTFDPNAQLETFCGSPPYAAPELFMGKKYAGPEVDAWSLGVVLFTLVSGSLPFDGGSIKELRERVLRGKYRVPYFISMDCENLMRKFLVLNPSKRTTLNAVIGDKWINLGYEESDRLRPHQEKPLDFQDASRIDMLVSMGHKRRDVESSLKAQAFDDIYCTYMLLGMSKPRTSARPATVESTISTEIGLPLDKTAPSGRPLPSRAVPQTTSNGTHQQPLPPSSATTAPAKPTRRTPARKSSACPTTNSSAAVSGRTRSPHTPQSRRAGHAVAAGACVTAAGALDVKPTLLSAQRQLAQAQKMANSPQRFVYQGSGRRPTTVYEKGETVASSTSMSTSSATGNLQVTKSPTAGRMLERLHIVNGHTAAAASSAPANRMGIVTGPTPSEKHFTRSNVARATFHFGQGRSKHGRSANNSDEDGYHQTPPLSADDTKPASRIGFFSKLTARFGRRVIQLNEKDSSDQRKNLTK